MCPTPLKRLGDIHTYKFVQRQKSWERIWGAGTGWLGGKGRLEVMATEHLHPRDLACGTLFQSSCVILTVPTTAEGTPFSGSMNTALSVTSDMWRHRNTYLLTHLLTEARWNNVSQHSWVRIVGFHRLWEETLEGLVSAYYRRHSLWKKQSDIGHLHNIHDTIAMLWV